MKKILLTEDDPFLIRVYKTKLSKLDYEVIMLEDGGLVLDNAINLKPDLIVLDIALKGKDGFTVLKELKENEKTKNIPVFVLTNLGMEEDFNEANKYQIDKYIVKSDVGIGDVINEIHDFLK